MAGASKGSRLSGWGALVFVTLAVLGALYVAGTPFTAWVDGVIPH